MWMYSWTEIAWIVAAAVAVDLIVGDPPRLPHPVVWIGRLISLLQRRLVGDRLDKPLEARHNGRAGERLRGVLLCAAVVAASAGLTWLVCAAAARIHPGLGYAAHVWLISTTIAIKGLRDAAMQVYEPLSRGDLPEARKWVGYIVGRDTEHLNEPEIARAAVETVAENTVDAVVSPIFYALLGGAPLAMLYRASNTLDSMVGYRSDKYVYFGWASARWDDVLNWAPARLTGLLLTAASLALPGYSARRAAAAIVRFARLHPSPNSGIPESAVAGALGVQLGGVNRYFGKDSERARLGWAIRPLNREDIRKCNRLLMSVAYGLLGVLICFGFAAF
ncbi:adenosylcobinamide-phosphate synthase CbiB [Paenibacillus thermoaerophilus]|uniref:Cobalamin biosynthesis protein CobD n=1 Tax=Paenibacillus thermoaerophilus TaxID=1215385 RepID=A0ABW2V247_9BACL|nr:cobalamin biosynthesis protein CobD [Paenibacillus thermoaerophilus]